MILIITLIIIYIIGAIIVGISAYDIFIKSSDTTVGSIITYTILVIFSWLSIMSAIISALYESKFWNKSIHK